MQASFFDNNRQRFSQSIHGGIAVLSAYTQMQRGNDMAFSFEQEANFWWLTGIETPDWWLIMDGSHNKSWLVAPNISESHQIFDGSLSAERASSISGIDAVLSHDEGLDLLRTLAKKHSLVYRLGDQPHAEYFDFILNPAIKTLRDVLDRIFTSTQDCRSELAQLRAIKQPEEIVAIKQAINLTIDGFEHVKQRLNGCSHEYAVEAEFSYYFRSHGAAGHGYDPIVASGGNACTLHYVANNQKLKKRQLLLLDIGARVGGYSADITRTYAYGEPTKRQQQIHAAVQSAHQQIISLIKPDVTVEHYQRQVDAIMQDALLSVGLLKDCNDHDAYRRYFPHAVSHGLGVDVHDSLGAPKFFLPGMVLTVEPGIYVAEDAIGVRIEDDILVTATGNSNLSQRLSTDL